VLHVLSLLLALIVRKSINPFSELVVSSPVLEGIIADARGEGCRSSAIIICLVSVVETLVCFDDGRGLVGYYRSLGGIVSRAPIEFPNFELNSIRYESNRVELRLINSIRFDKMRLYIEIRSRVIINKRAPNNTKDVIKISSLDMQCNIFFLIRQF
jgi:hypothetical protein